MNTIPSVLVQALAGAPALLEVPAADEEGPATDEDGAAMDDEGAAMDDDPGACSEEAMEAAPDDGAPAELKPAVEDAAARTLEPVDALEEDGRGPDSAELAELGSDDAAAEEEFATPPPDELDDDDDDEEAPTQEVPRVRRQARCQPVCPGCLFKVPSHGVCVVQRAPTVLAAM